MRWLNHTLPRDEFRAFANIHLGSHVEADVAEFDTRPGTVPVARNGMTATLPATVAYKAAFPAVFPDDIEVRITEGRHTMLLAGVIELVSPGNKKEADERAAFVAKCSGYLQRGIGLVIVDVVTERLANLHDEMMRTIGGPTPPTFPAGTPTYAVGYRPVRRNGRNEIDVCHESCVVGRPLPPIPVAVRGGPVVTLDLEKTYSDALADFGYGG